MKKRRRKIEIKYVLEIEKDMESKNDKYFEKKQKIAKVTTILVLREY
jgi:hypothetical protein